MNICSQCGIRQRLKVKIKGKDVLFKWCRRCRKETYDKPYLKHRKSYCEFCGFKPIQMCQLDVDHINGDHTDNKPNNLQTLCANCHRLKTYTQLRGLG